jgi:hypothetical protein
MIDSHSHIACGPETEVFVHELRECLEKIFSSGRYEEYMKPFSLQVEDIYHLFGATVMQAFFRRYLDEKGKKRWADKSPANVLHFDFLSKCFPDACFIHVIRDGRDCVCSLHDVKWYQNTLEDRKAFMQATKEWMRWVTAGRKQGRNLKNYLEIRYEALVKQPKQTIEHVLNFLNEPWNEKVLRHHERNYEFERSLDERNYKGAFTPVNTTRVGQWQRRMNKAQVRRFEKLAGELLKELSYF